MSVMCRASYHERRCVVELVKLPPQTLEKVSYANFFKTMRVTDRVKPFRLDPPEIADGYCEYVSSVEACPGRLRTIT